MRKYTAIVILCCAVILGVCPYAARAQEIDVRLEVESRDVYMGESFIMQININGSTDAVPPDVSSLDGFSTEYLGGSNNSSQSISIINGRMQRTVTKAFIFSYRLTPGRPGRLTIPALSVEVEGRTFSTQPVTIAVRRPSETEDFKLRMRLSKETCYVGEPVVLTVTWYLRRDVDNFRFTAPFFDNDAFTFADPEIKIDPSKKYYRIKMGDSEAIAVKGEGILKGETYATLQFSRALIPGEAGTFILPEIIVECDAVVGSRTGRDFFDGFFRDDFFRMRRDRLKKYVVPSNKLSLSVTELPTEGRPPGFAGHVGEYRISATAEPSEVSVGDPITLSVIIEGPDYLGSIDLPPLLNQKDLTSDFRIPDERADGRIEGRKKIFTQTIRALSEGVTEIPPIRLVYFDTKKVSYETAYSDPIPITVKATRVVTAQDAEGLETGPAGTPVEMWKEGIAYNYEGPEVVIPQDFGISSALGDPIRLGALVVPPIIYFVLLAGIALVRSRRSDPEARRARGALKRLSGRLETIGGKGDLSQAELCGEIMEALREYLGDKLRRPGATLTAHDVEKIMKERGADTEAVDAVRSVLATCEAGAYAGGLSSAEDRVNLVQRVRDAANRMEKIL
jgi:hypothetical protein